VDAAWTAVLARAGETPGHLAVVTHGLVCDAILTRHLDGARAVGAGGWGNTCVTVIEPPRHVRLLACTAHLDRVDDTTAV
jgi:broad specificity phosphatase PhoE